MKCLIVFFTGILCWINLTANAGVAAAPEMVGDNNRPSKIVKLSLYYQPFCPHSEMFFKDQLESTMKGFGNYIHLNLNPYGNAQTILGSEAGYPRPMEENYAFDFKCQHGKSECRSAIIQSCLIHKLSPDVTQSQMRRSAPNPTLLVSLLNKCIWSQPESRRDKLFSILNCIDPEVGGAGASHLVDQVEKCVTSREGKLLFKQFGEKTPPHNLIPYITFNDVWDKSLEEEAQQDLPKTLCTHFLRGVPECRLYNTVENRVRRRHY